MGNPHYGPGIAKLVLHSLVNCGIIALAAPNACVEVSGAMIKFASLALAAAIFAVSLAGSAQAVALDSADPPAWLVPDYVRPEEEEEEAPPEEAAEEPEDTSFTIDLSIVGDCMLATHKGQYYNGSFSWYAAHEEPYYFFEKVYDIFNADDFTIANLENVLTDRPLAEIEKNADRAFWFKAPTYNVYILRGGSVEAVSLANNHTGDYGKQGFRDTAAAVENAGLDYGTNDRTFYLEKNGFKIAVICHGLWNEAQAGQITKRIAEASECSDYQIVFYHGGKESIHEPEDWKVRATHKLVDAGADLVIGNHPHVLQPTEVYNGVNIVYSLGNFCYGGHTRPENRTVIYKMLLTIDEGKVLSQEVSLIPCYVFTGPRNNWQPAPITDEAERQKVLDFMYGKAKLPY